LGELLEIHLVFPGPARLAEERGLAVVDVVRAELGAPFEVVEFSVAGEQQGLHTWPLAPEWRCTAPRYVVYGEHYAGVAVEIGHVLTVCAFFEAAIIDTEPARRELMWRMFRAGRATGEVVAVVGGLEVEVDDRLPMDELLAKAAEDPLTAWMCVPDELSVGLDVLLEARDGARLTGRASPPPATTSPRPPLN